MIGGQSYLARKTSPFLQELSFYPGNDLAETPSFRSCLMERFALVERE